MYKNIHYSCIHNSPKLETALVVYLYGMLTSNKKELITDTCNLDESQITLDRVKEARYKRDTV